MFEEYFRIAFRNLRRRKLRSWLTIMGIFISITILFLLVSLSLGLQNAIEEQFRALGTDKIFIQPKGQLGVSGAGGAVSLTDADVDIIEKVQGVKEVSVMVISTAKVEFNDEIRFVNAIGLDPGSIDLFFESGGYTIIDGRNLRKKDLNDLVIGWQYKYKNWLKKPVDPGDVLLVNDAPFKVRGVISYVGSPPDDRQIYMTLEEFREFFNVSERVDWIVVQVDAGEDIELVGKKIEKKLRNFRDVDENTQDFTLMTPKELLGTFGSVLNILTGFLIGVAAISLLVGGIGIANTMYTTIIERTKEIGVIKAIGAKNSEVVLMFTVEAGIIGLVGGGLGVLVGMGLAQIVEFIASEFLAIGLLQAVFPWYLILGSLAFAFFIGVFSGMWPAWLASKVKPVVALRYE